MAMKDRAILISNASTEVGRAAAKMFDTQGYRVFAGVEQEDDLPSLSKEGSGEIVPMVLDACQVVQVQQLHAAIHEQAGDGALMGLVLTARPHADGPLEFTDDAALQCRFEANVFGPMRLVRTFLPMLRQSKGRIVCVSSMAGRIAVPYAGAESASKAALESLCDALRVELSPWGVEVSLVEPGTVAREGAYAYSEAWKNQGGKEEGMAEDLYGESFEAFMEHLTSQVNKGVSPEYVAEIIGAAIKDETPQTRYPIGKETGVWYLQNILPDRAMDRIRERLAAISA